MFQYYKRKVYRSSQGCCICKAKSSSSRFTDSKKYENDFIKCFQLSTLRKGIICNACVLVVKRFKRLPQGSNRNWGHVVDVRFGLGLKSINQSKLKKRKKEEMLLQQNGNIKKLANASSNQNTKTLIPTDLENVDVQFEVSDKRENVNNQINQSILHTKNQRKSLRPLKNRSQINASFIDHDFWMKKETCCGTVYENNLIGAVMIDSMFSSTCKLHGRLWFPKAENVCVPDDNVIQTASQTDAFPKTDPEE